MVAPKHAFWFVTCKNPKCAATIIAKHIGEHDGRPMYFLPTDGRGWWDFQCGECGQGHRYTRQDLKTLALDSAPPPTFQGWW